MKPIKASEIKNIIFDLGGVLLNINPLLSLIEFSKLSGVATEVLQMKLAGAGIFEKYDTGSISSADFRAELCHIMDKKVPDEVVDNAWNVLLLDFPAERMEMLKKISENYSVYLLSNTNSIHFDKYTTDFRKNYGIEMSSLFDKLFLSYEMGMHKPDEEIYRKVNESENLTASECLFIDDSLANANAAIAAGLQAIHHAPGNEVTQYFNEGFLIDVA